MGIFDYFKKPAIKALSTEQANTKEQAGLTGVRKDADIFKAYIPNYMYRPPFGIPRRDNVVLFKKLAKNPYIFSIIKTLCDEATTNSWEVKVKEEFQEHGDQYKDKINEITRFLKNPNGNEESFQHILRQLLTDLLETDSGVLVKVFNAGGDLKQIFSRDASLFLKNTDIYGYLGNRADFVMPLPDGFTGVSIDFGGTPTTSQQQIMKQYSLLYKEQAAYFQYGWTAGSMPIPFGKREIIYMMQMPRADSIYGTSPIGRLVDIILNLVYGAEFNLDFYTNNNMPDGAIQLLGAQREQIKQFRENMESQFKFTDDLGNKRKRFYKHPISTTEVKFTPFTFTAKDMEVLAQQKWFTKIMWMCYSDDTEILTHNGWMLFKDLQNEKVARYNVETANIDFIEPEDKQTFDYDGEMIRFVNRNIDLKVTPEHRVLYQTRDKFERGVPFEITEAKNLYDKYSCVVIPQAGNFKGIKLDNKKFGDLEFTGEQFSKFMGFWLGDGWADGCDNRVSFAVSKACYPEVYDKITGLFKEIGIEWKENEYLPRWTDKPMLTLRFSNKELNKYLTQFGKARDKFIPREIINSTEQETLSFLEYYEMADGCEEKYGRNKRFFSMSKKLIENCQEMYVRMGIASNINESNGGFELTERKVKTNKRDKKNYCYVYKESIIKEQYNGKVYDVTIPEHHNLIVRRNGRVCISGNCFGVNAEEMGFTEDSNKSTGETQIKAFKRKAIKPILDVISYHLNTQLLTEFFDNASPRDIPVEFVFDEYDIGEDIQKHALLEKQIQMGIKTPIMVAKELGIDTTELEKEQQKQKDEEQEGMESENNDNDNGDDKKEKEEKSLPNPLKEIDNYIDKIGDDISNAIGGLSDYDLKY